MRKELLHICFVARSKQKLNEINHLYTPKEGGNFVFNFKSSFVNKIKTGSHFDAIAVYFGDDRKYLDEVCKSINKEDLPEYTPVLFLGNFFNPDCFDSMKNKLPLVEFLFLPATPEYFHYKLNQLIGLRHKFLDKIKADLKSDCVKQSGSNKERPLEEVSITIVNKMLADRTQQLVKEINANIQSKIRSGGIFSDLNTDDDFINSLMETIPNPIFFKNDQNVYLGCNKAFEKLVKLKKNEIIGKSSFDFLMPGFAEKLAKQDRQTFKKNTPGYHEETVVFKDGSQMDVVIYRNVFTINENTQARGLIGIIVDNSHQRRSDKLIQIQHNIDYFSWSQGGLKQSMQYILRKLAEIDWIDCGGIYLFSEDKKYLVLINHFGLSNNFLEDNSKYTDGAPQFEFVKEKKTLFGNFSHTFKNTKQDEKREGLKAIAVIPLINVNEVIGSINLSSKKFNDVPENDKISIEAIAAKVAIVVAYLKSRYEVEKAKLQLETKVKLRTRELGQVNQKLQREIEFHKSTKDSLYYSENLYRSIFNNAQNSIVLYDAETFNVVDFNPQTYLDLGYTREEFIKLKTEDFTIYESKNQQTIIFNQLNRNKKVVYEVKHKTKSNRIKYSIISANLIEILDKKYILEIAHDVTRLRLAQFEIQQKDKKIKVLQENVSVGLFRINRKWVFIYANSYIADLAGEVNKEIMIGNNITDYIINIKIMKELSAKLEERGEVNNFELIIKRRDHTLIWTNLSIKGIRDELNKINYYDGSLEDITEIKNIQLELQKANKKISTINKNLKRKIDKAVLQEKKQQAYIVQKSKLESLGELAAGIAHEINQPLGIMSLTFENLQTKVMSRVFTEAYLLKKISSMSSNIERIRDIIDHIRIFSRDQESIVMEKVDINNVIMDIYKLIKTQYHNNNIDIVLNLLEPLGFTIGSKLKLEQVLLNLLSNAKHALEDSDKGGDSTDYKKSIRIDTNVVKNRISLSVEDNGTGIDPVIIGKLFDPFFTTKAEWVGTGLGLSIVYGIIKEMRGEIKVKSELGKYTNFQILLPRFPEKE
ncbi:MAG: PAS domain S-box protein [Bacteroidales bacterium]|nr:PAS domain S-box protein [Bacteroidales bacterium]